MGKRVILAAAVAMATAGSASALSITNSSDAAMLAAAAVGAGGGVSIVAGTETLIGTTIQQGLFTDFNQGPADGKIVLADGVYLTTGGGDFSTTTNTTNQWNATAGTGSNAELTAILAATNQSSTTFDQNVLSFDFIVEETSNSVRGNFVFATEEFPTQSVTDVMGIFVNGVNYAFFSDGALVRNRQGINDDFFNSNPVDSTLYGMEWNGVTNVLTFNAPVNQGANTFTLAIADTSDALFDSAVFFSGLVARTDFTDGGITDEVGQIPLPASALLLLVGVAALAARRRAA